MILDIKNKELTDKNIEVKVEEILEEYNRNNDYEFEYLEDNMYAIDVIDASDNELTSLEYFLTFENLKKLNISSNKIKISDIKEKELSFLSELEQLNISDNEYKDEDIFKLNKVLENVILVY